MTSPLRASILLAGLTAACGCQQLPPSKPVGQLTAQELAGRQTFLLYCAKCHYPTSTKGLYGPGLEGLFRRPYLHNGAPANDERVTAEIWNGHGMMPAFGDKLDDRQLKDLLAYLHTL